MTGMLGRPLPPGLNGFVQGQQMDQQRQMQQLGMLAQMQQIEGANADRQMRGDQMRMQMEERQRKAAQEAALLQAKSRLFAPQSPVAGVLSQGAAEGDVGPTVGNAQRLAQAPSGGFNLSPRNVQEYLAAGGDPKTIEAYQKITPAGNIKPFGIGDVQAPSLARFLQTGDHSVLQPRDPLHFADTGGAIIGLDKFTGLPASPQTFKNDPNKPFSMGPGGPTPNAPFQQYELTKAATGATRNTQINNPMRQTFKDEQDLRKEYMDQSGSFIKLTDGYRKVKAALAADATTSAPATLAAATQFMKMLDPESVVRESELGMALAAAGLWDRFTNIYNTVRHGKVLTPEQAKEFGRIADTVYGAANTGQQGRVKHYRGLATSYNFDPARVVPEIGPQSPIPYQPNRRSGDKSYDFSAADAIVGGR